MSDDRLAQAWANTHAERAAAIGWEPPDWDVVQRQRRRRQLIETLGLAALVLVVVPVTRWLTETPASPLYPVWVIFVLVHAGLFVRSRYTRRGRDDWTEEARREIRVEHALRENVSIGDDAPVTERAQLIRFWARASFVGLPLLGLAAVAWFVTGDGPPLPAKLAASGAVLLGCAWLLWRRVRRYRLAQRWLAGRSGDRP